MNGISSEVLVIGGGPAGSATAALLASSGFSVVLLEKSRFPREKPCAEYLSPGVIDVLGRLGALTAVQSAGASWPLGMRVYGKRQSFLVSYSDRGAEGSSARRTALGIPRWLFDQLLLENARERGVEIYQGVRATCAAIRDGKVVGARARSSEGEQVFTSRFLVVADGLRSSMARSIGIKRQAGWPHRLGLVARHEGMQEIDQIAEMHVGPGFYCGLAPVGQGLVNVGLVTPLDARAPGESVKAFFERKLASLPGVASHLRNARRVSRIRGMGPLSWKARQVAGPGYLLVGDAAGFLDPFTGEGVYRALRGAELAAQSVEQALKKNSPAPREYKSLRQVAFGDKERLCMLIQLFLCSSVSFDYVLARLAQRPQQADYLSATLGDYAPAGPALSPGYLWSLLKPL